MRGLRLIAAAMCALAGLQVAWAQPAAPPAGMVQLNLQQDVQLRVLIDLVSQRLGINFIYSAEIGNRMITVRAPREIPAASLMSLLSSILRMEQLALVDADVPGWKRIVDAPGILNQARPVDPQAAIETGGAATPVVQVFALRHASAEETATTIRPFLTGGGVGGGSNVVAVRESNLLVVTDFAPTVLSISRLIALIDRPASPFLQEFYTVQHLPAVELATRLKGLMERGDPAQPGSRPIVDVAISADPRTNQLVIGGPEELVRQTVELARRFDVSLQFTTRVYRFGNVQAERFDRILKGYLSTEDQRLYTSSVDEEGNLLIVRAAPEIHQRIDELRPQIDVSVPASKSPIRFYKLKNANALDVLYTLLSLQEVAGAGVLGGNESSVVNPAAATAVVPAAPGMASPMTAVPGMTVPGAMPGAVMPGAQVPMGGAQTVPGQPNVLNLQLSQPPMSLPLPPQADRPQPYDTLQQMRQDRLSSVTGFGIGTSAAMTLPGGARVSADPTTNSIVIVAPPETQEMYRSLIERLDQRAPQVMIDAKIVAVDTTDDFRLGVEISGGDRTGAKRLFAFTSYGLSQVDPVTGALQILPDLGFNGTLVNPDVADSVVQALAAHTRARVLASPRILVNDNRTGQLESVVSVPFQSVNATNTVSTTSLGGNQQAGTVITVTPHINEDDHLSLEFTVEFSTFTGNPTAATLPPPRQIDRVGSVVTIPDGQTIIVGGLKRVGSMDTLTGIPYLEKIPIVRELTSLTTENKATTSFFLFIRPVILRDDRFADLRYLSNVSADHAEIEGEYPASLPIIVK